jgi:hypothetical protein
VSMAADAVLSARSPALSRTECLRQPKDAGESVGFSAPSRGSTRDGFAAHSRLWGMFMRRSIPILLVPVMLAAFTPALHAQTTLRYDGIYQSQAEEGTQWSREQAWTYLRFTPDGMVITFPTSGRPEQLGSFSLANVILAFASVTVRDGRISFTVSDCGGVLVDYEGRTEGDRLYLHVRSNYNGYQADQVFAFIPIPPERMRQWDNSPGWAHEPCGPFGSGGL